MNKIIVLLAGVCIFTSCSEKKTDKKPSPAFLESIKYKDWEIGDPENIKPVLAFYTNWDKKEMQNMAGIFADPVSMSIPDEREDLVTPNNEINALLSSNRDMYEASANTIVSALSLHDRESNEDWVVTMVYSKWTENGKRDSLLYSDNWRIKDGKIATLLSFAKKPSYTFLKRNDPVK